MRVYLDDQPIGAVHNASIDLLLLQTDRPFPPGKRMDVAIQTSPPFRLRIKVNRIQALPEGDYKVEAHPINWTQPERHRLLQQLESVVSEQQRR